MCFIWTSFLVYHSVRTNYTVSCLASCSPPLFFFLRSHRFSLLLLLPRPRWALIGLLGIKTWSLGEERDIWEQDGKGDGGHIPTWSPSSVSVEAVVTRRWVIFSACVQHPAVQHLWITLCLGLVADKPQSAGAECIFDWIFSSERFFLNLTDKMLVISMMLVCQESANQNCTFLSCR